MIIKSSRLRKFSEILPEFPRGRLIDKGMCGNGMTTALILDTLATGKKTVLAFPSRFLAEQKASLYHDDNRVVLCCGGTPWRDADLGQKSLILTTYNTACALVDERRIDTGEWDLFIDEYHKCADDKAFRNDVLLKLGKICSRFRSFGAGTATPPRFLPGFLSGLPKIKITYPDKPPHSYNVYNSRPSEAMDILVDEIKSSDVPMRMFINSVADILSIISSAGLKADDTGIVCSRHSPHAKSADVKPFIYLPNKPMPKYLFITSSGFDGIDLFDEKAKTIVWAFASTTNMLLDPTTAIAQISGRQRRQDFWLNSPPIDLYLLIIPSGDHRITDSQFAAFLQQQVESARPLVSSYNRMISNSTISRELACEYMAINNFDESSYNSKKISWHGAVFFDDDARQLDIDDDYVPARVSAHNLRHTIYSSTNAFCGHIDSKHKLCKHKDVDAHFARRNDSFKGLIKKHLAGDTSATRLLMEKHAASFYWLQDNQMDEKLLALPTRKIHLLAKLANGLPALAALRADIAHIALGRSDAIDGWVSRSKLWDEIKDFFQTIGCDPINPAKIISFASYANGVARRKLIDGDQCILPMAIGQINEWHILINDHQADQIEAHYSMNPPKGLP